MSDKRRLLAPTRLFKSLEYLYLPTLKCPCNTQAPNQHNCSVAASIFDANLYLRNRKLPTADTLLN